MIAWLMKPHRGQQIETTFYPPGSTGARIRPFGWLLSSGLGVAAPLPTWFFLFDMWTHLAAREPEMSIEQESSGAVNAKVELLP
jgi:hypothetical protein